MKKILVPTDYSDCANDAIEVAKVISARSGAELFMLHLEEVMPEAVLSHTIIEEYPHRVGQAHYILQQLVDSVVKEGLMAKAVFVPHEGNEDILDYIKPYGIDFMIMGSHGAKGIREFIIGSKTQKVIRKSPVPVLVIKRPDKNFNPSNILFASTFREDMSKPLKEVAEFARLWNADLNLVFINLMHHLIEENEAKDIMASQMESIPDIKYTLNITETNDEVWGIRQFAKLVNADVIAVVYDANTGFNRLFKSAVAEKLINHEEIPILVMTGE